MSEIRLVQTIFTSTATSDTHKIDQILLSLQTLSIAALGYLDITFVVDGWKQDGHSRRIWYLTEIHLALKLALLWMAYFIGGIGGPRMALEIMAGILYTKLKLLRWAWRLSSILGSSWQYMIIWTNIRNSLASDTAPNHSPISPVSRKSEYSKTFVAHRISKKDW